ncbi:MAG TPA: carboxylating nicotinate-nucleotide diphosphorylase [Pyrinomonadaceae bacterium]|nr:carboxylating nicotinate-nucleotide diphosphorylase [Pyrinomonadaceae bacterium]
MNWMDEGALYSQIADMLREDLGRGDITSQAIVERNTRARGRFVANEKMVVAGLEAAEEVFLTLDSQQQLESFVADGEEIAAGKVIARTAGFADILLAGERVALTLMQRLSAVATSTGQFVHAVAGTGAQIVASRETTPGLRMLERYAVLLGGGKTNRFGLDDGVVITSNHLAVTGGLAVALRHAKEKLGHAQKIQVQVSNEQELRTAVNHGADILIFESLSPEQVGKLTEVGRALSPSLSFECSGRMTAANARAYAEAGANVIRINLLQCSPAVMDISFVVRPF